MRRIWRLLQVGFSESVWRGTSRSLEEGESKDGVGNMFSMAAASLFLPVLPMLRLKSCRSHTFQQIFLRNFKSLPPAISDSLRSARYSAIAMSTVAQVQANRLNALRSTGPRSGEGKAASRFNALKSGIDARSLVIPGEDPAELEALTFDYRQTLRPVGPLEDFLVETLVAADWNRRRYAGIEAQLVRLLAASQDPLEENPLGAVLLADAAKGNALQKVFRRLNAAERSYFRALDELRRARRERLAAGVDVPLTEAAGIPPIGFVSAADAPQPEAPVEAVPNSAPTPAVAAMASAPQNVTRSAPTTIPAPPARAANAPRSARNNSEVPETNGIRPAAGAMAVTAKGMAAPTAKQPADASEA